ncbi:MAG: dTDP-4-dehydrorhamnose 3,5-epimerase [Pseudomonadales bacterium]
MIVTDTDLPGVRVIEPSVFKDKRGYFLETYNAPLYQEAIGSSLPFVQDNLSYSRGNVLRGLHAQKNYPQGKLVRVVRGSVFDVAVDINPSSDTFAQWVGFELNDTNQKQIWIPPGYAHGFAVLSAEAIFEYKCTDVYHPNDEIGVIWNDKKIGVNWPITNPLLSTNDSQLPTLEDLLQDLT